MYSSFHFLFLLQIQKAYAYADEDEARPSNDCLLIYDIEGVGSPAGSVGCCSFIGEDLDDSFLDTLGPKFKKLADISLGKGVEPYPDLDRSALCREQSPLVVDTHTPPHISAPPPSFLRVTTPRDLGYSILFLILWAMVMSL